MKNNKQCQEAYKNVLNLTRKRYLSTNAEYLASIFKTIDECGRGCIIFKELQKDLQSELNSNFIARPSVASSHNERAAGRAVMVYRADIELAFVNKLNRWNRFTYKLSQLL